MEKTGSRFTRGLHRVLNIGVTPDLDVNTQRCYRQINGLTLFYSFVAGTTGILIWCLDFPVGIVGIQFGFSLIYLVYLGFTAKHKLRLLQHIVTYTFELQVFLISVMVVRLENGVYVSDALYGYYLFPMLAMLAEISVLQHLGIGLMLIAAFYLIGWNDGSFYESVMIGTPELNHEIFRLLELVVLPVMATVIVAIIRRENVRARQEVQEQVVLREEMAGKMEAEVKVKEEEVQKRYEAVKLQEQAESALQAKVAEIEKVNKYMVDRELRMSELKKENETLKRRLEGAQAA